MDKLRCMVVDDEPLAVNMLENYISRTSFLELAGSFNDPVQALNEINAQGPDIVFLDIQMPDMSGLELAGILPKGTEVIFTTAFKDYALESYDVGAVGYLLKPIRYQKFVETTQKARDLICLRRSSARQKPDSIFIKADGNMHQIRFSDILYISGMKDYLCVQTGSQTRPLITHLTMKAAEEMLPKDMFMRVHKSFIVALGKIESVSSSLDIVISGKLIHVGDQYSSSFRLWLEHKAFGQ